MANADTFNVPIAKPFHCWRCPSGDAPPMLTCTAVLVQGPMLRRGRDSTRARWPKSST
jgi:hypothetical protein